MQLISESAKNENTLTITLTETHLNEKILDKLKNTLDFEQIESFVEKTEV